MAGKRAYESSAETRELYTYARVLCGTCAVATTCTITLVHRLAQSLPHVRSAQMHSETVVAHNSQCPIAPLVWALAGFMLSVVQVRYDFLHYFATFSFTTCISQRGTARLAT